MALITQIDAAADITLIPRMNAAIYRHAVYLATKVSPTTAEIAFYKAILSQRYDDISLLARCRTMMCAYPTIYNASAFTSAVVTDAILLAIVPDLPAAIQL